MMHDTDFHMITDLKACYRPKTRGIVSNDEALLIQQKLQLPNRTDVELQNVRDITVMLYGQWASTAQDQGDTAKAMTFMDAMSAITAVIDQEKTARGLDV